MTISRPLILIFSACALIALSSCGSGKRHPMIQKEIDQCIAGLSGLIPDAAKRQETCECTSDAMQEDRQYAGERTAAYEDSYLKKVQACGGPDRIPGSSATDPFGILKDKPEGANVSGDGSGETFQNSDTGSDSYGEPMVNDPVAEAGQGGDTDLSQ
ncbi:hypothetical protein [Novosphingobium sp. MMS21-SN21R]|uniref:hypothetical protein n=1 Tax=Novosphingobium sp. MMS21-SN21R TaxID=2969298 RepID=UPI002884551B|nr:hypothetical protein [Novosphingobium sp. MMS21-SN21R]MDT0506693.1 hypothetical protein [Novosphingobium sp. MMS21-SN21R]